MRMFLIGALSMAALAPALRAEPTKLDGAAAYVNGTVITVGDVMESMESQRRQFAAKLSGPELEAKLRTIYEDHLNALIDRRLIIEAYEKQKLRLDDSVVDRRVSEIINERYSNDRSELMADLAEDRITFVEWRAKVREQLILGAMRHENVEKYVIISPPAVRKFYDDNLERYTKPGKVQLSMIVLDTGTSAETAAAKRKIAEDVANRLKAGEDFSAIAKTVSEDNKASVGGDWGWINPKLLHASLAAAAVSLQPRQHGGPIEAENSIYLLKCEGRQESSPVPFEDVRSAIEKELRDQESARLYRLWTRRLRENAYVKPVGAVPF